MGPTRVEVRRSTDGGYTFARADAGIQGAVDMPVQLLTMDRNNPAVLFAGTDRIFRTANGDAANPATVAWSAASAVIGTVTEVTIAASSSLIVYAGTLDGALFQATNGGTMANSFADITPPVAAAPDWPRGRWLSGITVDPNDPFTMYVTFLGANTGQSSDHVWKGVRSAGGAWTWTNISSDLRDVPVSALALDPAAPGTLYVSSDVGVSCSTDDGGHWDNVDDGLPNVLVVDLDLDPGRRVLRAATHGRGMYELRLDGPCLPVDIFVRDHNVDPGDQPSVDGPLDPARVGQSLYHWQSADIKVDAPPYDALDALVDGVEFDDPPHRVDPVLGYALERLHTVHHDNPRRGEVNHVYVQVHNRALTAQATDKAAVQCQSGRETTRG